MAPVNIARFEEGTEILVDQEIVAADPGYTITYASVNRVGSLVAAHIELTFAAGAAAAVAVLPSDFAPGQTVKDPTGNFSLSAAGALTYTGSTTAAGAAVLQLVYQAGSVSP